MRVERISVYKPRHGKFGSKSRFAVDLRYVPARYGDRFGSNFELRSAGKSDLVVLTFECAENDIVISYGKNAAYVVAQRKRAVEDIVV